MTIDLLPNDKINNFPIAKYNPAVWNLQQPCILPNKQYGRFCETFFYLSAKPIIMTAAQIMQSNLLDILFDGRNKSYGAYPLRKGYPTRIKKSLALMLSLVSLLTLSYLFANRNRNNVPIVINVNDSTRLTPIDMTKKTEPPKPKPAMEKPAPKKDVATVKNVIPVIVPDKEVTVAEVPPIDQIDTSAYGKNNKTGPATTGNVTVSDKDGNGRATENKEPIAEPEMPTGPIDIAEFMPEFPGGHDALMRFWQRHLAQPELEDGVKVVVRIQFIVDQTGNITEAKILQSGGPELDNNVQHAIGKMPNWKPGRQNGKNVSVRFIQSVTFQGSN